MNWLKKILGDVAYFLLACWILATILVLAMLFTVATLAIVVTLHTAIR